MRHQLTVSTAARFASTTALFITLVSALLGAAPAGAQPVSGVWRGVPPAPPAWQPREFKLPTAATAPGGLSETTRRPFHPWLDWRMSARFVGPSGQRYDVPGFYAADGDGGDRGSVWKVRFSPDQAGTWRMTLRFEQAALINVFPLSVRGTPVIPHGLQTTFDVGPVNRNAPGFLRHGALEYVGEHYLRFRDGTWFLKGGTDSPENFLGYAGFDGAADMGGLPRGTHFLHRYANHVRHWRRGDPNWTSGGDPNAGKGIIGALNYLQSQDVNSIYFLPLNLGGDGQETFPFVNPTSNAFDAITHYDVGRMEQWNRVFEHAQRCGILLSFVLAEQETDNIAWLRPGLSIERKLFFKNLVAHFGHNLAIRWVLCEENSAEPTDEFPVSQLAQFADWIRQWATFEHPIAVHTDPDDQRLYQQILQSPTPGFLTATSLQLRSNYAPQLEATRAMFLGAGRKPVLDQDEQGPPRDGLTDTNHDDRRKLILWDVYLSGGNIEWYMGDHLLPLGGDLSVEDFATRSGMWRHTRRARRLLQTFPFWRMEPRDDLVSGETVHAIYGDAEVFTDLLRNYIVYYADASRTGTLDLRAVPSGTQLRVQWFNPRTGSAEGRQRVIAGGGVLTVGAPPSSPREDWVLTVRPR